MSEHLRDVVIRATIDTNKRTETFATSSPAELVAWWNEVAVDCGLPPFPEPIEDADDA